MNQQKKVLSIIGVILTLVVVLLIIISIIKIELIKKTNNKEKEAPITANQVLTNSIYGNLDYSIYGAKPDQGEVDDPATTGKTYTGIVYYIDSINGNDSNNGTSPTQSGVGNGPWKNLSKAQEKFPSYLDTRNPSNSTVPPFHPIWTAAPAGSTFLFARGGTYTVAPNAFSKYTFYTSIPNITFGAYGEGPRPIIKGFLAAKAKTTFSNLHIIPFEGVYNPVLTVSETDGTQILNTEIGDDIINATGDGILADESSPGKMKNLFINNTYVHNTAKSGGNGGGMAGTGNDGGTGLSGGYGLIVSSSTFDNNGLNTVTQHGFYLHNTKNAKIENNIFSNSSDAGIVFHGTPNNVTITHNLFENNNVGLIVTGAAYGTYEALNNFIIDGNVIKNNNHGSAKSAVMLSSVQNMLFINNLIYGNYLDFSSGIPKDAPSANVTIAHNTFYNAEIIPHGITSKNIKFLNNIITSNATSRNSANSYNRLITADRINASEFTFDYNLYYAPNFVGTQMFAFEGTGYSPITFKSVLGREINGIFSDPLFTDSYNKNFHLLNSSPAIDTGTSMFIYKDFEGTSRPQGNGYDLGAYESTRSLSTPNNISNISNILNNGPECSDGIDNDHDGLIDWQYDLGCYGPSDEEIAQPREQENGWTTYDPSPNAAIMYLSSSTGNDSYDGLAGEWNGTSGPKKTLFQGMLSHNNLCGKKNNISCKYDCACEGWLLLKRGDVWKDEFFGGQFGTPPNVYGGWTIYGINESKRAILASYGNSKERPRLENKAGSVFMADLKDYVSILGIHFYKYSKDPNNPEFTGKENWQCLSNMGWTGLLYEDNYFDYCGITAQTYSSQVTNFSLRRNIISDSYSVNSHAQSIFSSNVENLLIEENLLNSGGWNDEFRLLVYSPNNNISEWKKISDGKTSITLYNKTHSIESLDFSSVNNLLEVAQVIEQKLRIVTQDNNLEFKATTGNGFVLKTKKYPSSDKYKFVIYNSSASGTDIANLINLPVQGSPESTVFNRNMYLSGGNGKTIVRGNIDANGASGGVQQRKGGINENNLYLQNPHALSFGHNQNSANSTIGGLIRNNVVLGSRNIDSQVQGSGILISSHSITTTGGYSHIDGLQVYNNIIAHQELGTGNFKGLSIYGYGGDGVYNNLDVHNNIVYNWSSSKGGGLAVVLYANKSSINANFINNIIQQPDFGGVASLISATGEGLFIDNNTYYSAELEQPKVYNRGWFFISSAVNSSTWFNKTQETNANLKKVDFPNPERNINKYMEYLGYPTTQQTFESFIKEAKKQSRLNWREEYTAGVVNDYIREGFGMKRLNEEPSTPVKIQPNKPNGTKQKIIKTFDGNTTDIEKLQDLKNINNFVIEKQAYGFLRFLQKIDFLINKSAANITEIAEKIEQNVKINKNTIVIDSENIPELNTSAIITLYNLTFEKPTIFRNGEKCPTTVCQITSYNKTTKELTFIVMHFTNYTIIEEPTTPTTPTNPSGGGGSGGGGSTITRNNNSSNSSTQNILENLLTNIQNDDEQQKINKDGENSKKEGINNKPKKILILNYKQLVLIIAIIILTIIVIIMIKRYAHKNDKSLEGHNIKT